MNWIARLCIATLGAALASGCASWKSVPGGTGEGYDVYRPEPYLLVVRGDAPADGEPPTTAPATQPPSESRRREGACSARIIWLPDYSQRYRISSKSSGETFIIKDGWQLLAVSDENLAGNLLAGLLSNAGTVTSTAGSVASHAGPLAIIAEQQSRGNVGQGSASALSRAFGLYKIIYNAEGHVAGLVKLEAGEDPASMQQRLADHHPPSALPPPASASGGAK